jgi:D-alanyl-D-alanine carboxypeptidase (penicillin-binding protein 5/6)
VTPPRRAAAGFLLALVALACLGGSASAAGPPPIEARAWTLVDARTGDVLTSQAADRRLAIASATKLMTAYVAMHELALGEIVRAAPYQAIYGESLLGLRVGQRVNVRDLLYGLILRSGNDAAYDLALAAAGSKQAFVRQMNLRAAALGLTNTHFANPIGLDQAGNYSSAADLASLARRLLRMPAFAKIAASRRALLRSLRPRRRIETLNDFLFEAPWATGVKTGHTFDAGYVLVGSGRRNGVSLVSAVIGAPSEEERDRATEALLEFGFSRYRRRKPVQAGQVLVKPSIRYSDDALPLRAGRTVVVGVRRGQGLSLAVRAPEEVEGPIPRGTRLGRAIVRIDGRRAASVPLLAARSVEEASALQRAWSLGRENLLWLLIAGSAILLAGLAVSRRLSR